MILLLKGIFQICAGFGKGEKILQQKVGSWDLSGVMMLILYCARNMLHVTFEYALLRKTLRLKWMKLESAYIYSLEYYAN